VKRATFQVEAASGALEDFERRCRMKRAATVIVLIVVLTPTFGWSEELPYESKSQRAPAPVLLEQIFSTFISPAGAMIARSYCSPSCDALNGTECTPGTTTTCRILFPAGHCNSYTCLCPDGTWDCP